MILHYLGWELWYFNYWLTHMFYFAAGLIILFAFASNKWEKYKNKLLILNRLERYSNCSYLPIPKEVAWPLNQ